MKKEKCYSVKRREDGRYEVAYRNPQTGYLKTAISDKIVLISYVDGHEERKLETKQQLVKRLCNDLGIEY